MMAGGRALVEQFYNKFSSGDLDQAVELFAPDVVTVEPFLGRAESRDAWRAYGEAFRRACPDARLVLRSSVEQHDRVAVEGTFVGTFTETLDGPPGPCRRRDGPSTSSSRTSSRSETDEWWPTASTTIRSTSSAKWD
jgi:predicted ester cyclase